MVSFRTTETGERLTDIYRGTDSEATMNLNNRSSKQDLKGNWDRVGDRDGGGR